MVRKKLPTSVPATLRPKEAIVKGNESAYGQLGLLRIDSHGEFLGGRLSTAIAPFHQPVSHTPLDLVQFYNRSLT